MQNRTFLGQWQAMPENEFVTNPTFGDKVWSRIESPGWCAFVDRIFWGLKFLFSENSSTRYWFRGYEKWHQPTPHAFWAFVRGTSLFKNLLIVWSPPRSGNLMIPDDPKEERAVDSKFAETSPTKVEGLASVVASEYVACLCRSQGIILITCKNSLNWCNSLYQYV